MEVKLGALPLQPDGVSAFGTLLRRYDEIEPAALLQTLTAIGAHLTLRNIEAVRGQRRTSRVYQFVHLAVKYLSSDPVVLAHLAGLSEMRLNLRAYPEDWFPVGTRAEQYAGRSRSVWKKPDAYWRPDGEEHWIEYDRGTYTPLDRRLKIMAAAEHRASLYWGDPSDSRLDRVRRQATDYVLADNAREQARGSSRRTHLNFYPVPTYWHVRSEAEFADSQA